MIEDIRKIVEVAVNAPSGENVQPWKFRVKEDQLYVYNIPERDQSPYNFMQRGSLVAHGALIENILIASSSLGFEANVDLFKDSKKEDLVAVISFIKSTPKEEPLFPYITKRSTNRKPYKKTPLNAEQRQEILGSNNIGQAKVLLTENKDDIKILSLVGSMNERLVLENEVLHNFLFSHINWTEEENKEKVTGFYIKTLELPPPAQMAFKLFSHWSILKKLHKLGVSKAIWKQNGKTYASSSAIGIIAMQGNRKEDFINAGRATQRIWLTITKLGLSLQPMTGTLFFMQSILTGNREPFTDYQVELIKESYGNVCKIFKLKNETVPMMFRIGYSDPPTARALKLTPQIVFD